MDIENKIIAALGQLTTKKVKKTSSIEELEIDSLDLVELVVDFESKYEVTISDDELRDLESVKDIITCFQSKVNDTK